MKTTAITITNVNVEGFSTHIIEQWIILMFFDVLYQNNIISDQRIELNKLDVCTSHDGMSTIALNDET